MRQDFKVFSSRFLQKTVKLPLIELKPLPVFDCRQIPSSARGGTGFAKQDQGEVCFSA